jgi:hypothetical protein
LVYNNILFPELFTEGGVVLNKAADGLLEDIDFLSAAKAWVEIISTSKIPYPLG